ncbi:hypothetical protein C8R46DRAFT_1123909 [Mycena filopes]|nr:hypothetical protein C8R46DRAFT_1123909 [Mycena filopes]
MLSILRLRAAPRSFQAARHQLLRPISTSIPAFSTPPPAPKPVGSLSLTSYCSNCLREGHAGRHCKMPPVCGICRMEGHKRRNCPTPDNPAPPPCMRCNDPGHSIQECTAVPICYHCGVEGHFLKHCEKRKAEMGQKVASDMAAKKARGPSAAKKTWWAKQRAAVWQPAPRSSDDR